MKNRFFDFFVVASLSVAPLAFAGSTLAEEVILVERSADPNGSPRPGRDWKHVPLKTSIYFELRTKENNRSLESIGSSLEAVLCSPAGVERVLLSPGRKFGPGIAGWLKPKTDLAGGKSLAVYLDPAVALLPKTRYKIIVSVRNDKNIRHEIAQWFFTTESASNPREIGLTLDFKSKPVVWHGRFFSGLCNVIFCSREYEYGPTYDLMAKARSVHPRAWRYQRDFWPTGTEFRPTNFPAVNLPNVVLERETRRIKSMRSARGRSILQLEDVFGHEQYGIPSHRPLTTDYHPGDEVLVADGLHDARSRVIAVDDALKLVSIAAISEPQGGWKLAYDGPLPTRENPDAPGLFAPGGCYLRKYSPVGTPHYYWGRLDKEWDLAVRRYGRRLMVNFADAPGDLSRDGRSWTTAKDLAEWHDVVQKITGHLIDRYGENALDFTWSVFNEPDLGALFWRADWNELQSFYDYASDAVLRAFEDRGFDSNRVFIGGLELGGIFGTNLRLSEFLSHCSPRAQAKGALAKNAAFADPRLEGKRSRRVETLCRKHRGKGSPCDFISIHAYNRSEMTAAKMFEAKKRALEIDPDYYRTLWINSHEACPDWLPPPDEAAKEIYLGNGYFPSWCLDVVDRLLRRAARDERYSYGESILTVWPPPENFAGLNALTRLIPCDDHGDGRRDRWVTVPLPIFHVLCLLSDLGDEYRILPENIVEGHKIGGFASSDPQGVLRILLFAHHSQDTQSRSEARFHIRLAISGSNLKLPAKVTEYRFDQFHNSPFRLIQELGERFDPREFRAEEDRTEYIAGITSDDPQIRRRTIRKVQNLKFFARQSILTDLVEHLAASGKIVPDTVQEAIKEAFRPSVYPPETIERIRRATECVATTSTLLPKIPNGEPTLKIDLSGNGCVFIVIQASRTGSRSAEFAP